MVRDGERQRRHCDAAPADAAERGAAVLARLRQCLAELDALGWDLAAGHLSLAIATIELQLADAAEQG